MDKFHEQLAEVLDQPSVAAPLILWSTLPDKIKQTKSLDSFKSLIKTPIF